MTSALVVLSGLLSVIIVALILTQRNYAADAQQRMLDRAGTDGAYDCDADPYRVQEAPSGSDPYRASYRPLVGSDPYDRATGIGVDPYASGAGDRPVADPYGG